MDQTNYYREIVEKYEFCKDLLGIKYAHYFFDHKINITEDKLKIIEEFLNWLIIDLDKDLNIPRGKDKKSYIERASES